MATLKSKAKYDLVEPRKNFKISHEDESILGCLDPCGMCVTKGQMQDGTLCNRLIFCLLAVVMLWASSFTTAVYIANSSISSPDFEAVVASCDSAYSLTATQKADYVKCVDTQLQQCDKDFATVLNQQVKATNEALNANAAVLATATFAQEHCSASFTTAQVHIFMFRLPLQHRARLTRHRLETLLRCCLCSTVPRTSFYLTIIR